MKLIAIVAVVLGTVISSLAEVNTFEELSSHLFDRATIEWQAPTNSLPKSLWVYQRTLPRVFSKTIISNALVLGSLQSKGFPPQSTKNFYIWEDKGRNYPGPIPGIFTIRPGEATIDYSMPNYNSGSDKEIPADETILTEARNSATKLGLDSEKLIQNGIYTHWRDIDHTGVGTKVGCGRGVFSSRQLEGISFFSGDDEGSDAEGFSIEFGSRGQVRRFSLRWSELRRYQNQPVAGPKEIMQCIRAHKTIVLPVTDEDYFGKLRKLALVKKLTITKITPYYCESVFGEIPTNDVPCKYATPIAELEGRVDYGSSNGLVRIYSPIVLPEVVRLLGSKGK